MSEHRINLTNNDSHFPQIPSSVLISQVVLEMAQKHFNTFTSKNCLARYCPTLCSCYVPCANNI